MNVWLYIGTWNVMTMLKPGKMKEISEQMLSSQIQIIALQEVRWKGHGQIKKNKYSIYYSCSQQNTGQFGTGFMVKKEIEKNIMSFTPINERICTLRLKGKFHNVTLINVHAPTEEKIEEKDTVFALVICALFFSILAAEKSGCVKYADFFCGGLDLGFILV